jgi:hypothetical protein
MLRREATIVVAAIAMAACAHEAPPRTVTASSQETAAPSPPASPAAPTDVSGSSAPPIRPPQSDPIGPPAPRCPNVASLMNASAFVKREPPHRGQPSPSPPILDIELTVVLPANPAQVTLVPKQLNVYGGVLVEQTPPASDPTKYVALIRPFGTVGRDGTLMALYGVACTGAKGTIRVYMTFVTPLHDGDRVTVISVIDY